MTIDIKGYPNESNDEVVSGVIPVLQLQSLLAFYAQPIPPNHHLVGTAVQVHHLRPIPQPYCHRLSCMVENFPRHCWFASICLDSLLWSEENPLAQITCSSMTNHRETTLPCSGGTNIWILRRAKLGKKFVL